MMRVLSREAVSAMVITAIFMGCTYMFLHQLDFTASRSVAHLHYPTYSNAYIAPDTTTVVQPSDRISQAISINGAAPGSITSATYGSVR